MILLSDIDTYFTLPADWRGPITVHHRWLTGIQKSILGREKRSSYISNYRLEEEFPIFAYNYTQNAWLKRQIMVNQYKIWGIPIWPDVTDFVSGTKGTKTLVLSDTTYRHFKINGLGIIISNTDFQVYEPFFITNIVGNTLTLSSNILATWTAGTSVYPLFAGTIKPDLVVENKTAELSKGVIYAKETFKGVTT